MRRRNSFGVKIDHRYYGMFDNITDAYLALLDKGYVIDSTTGMCTKTLSDGKLIISKVVTVSQVEHIEDFNELPE